MAPLNSPKIIFVVLLVIQCLLWSKSRYGNGFVASNGLEYSGGIGSRLVRRYFDEGRNGSGTIHGLLEPEEKECSPLSHPPSSQCTHVHSACPASHTFLSINYVKQYFCTTPASRPITFILLILWLIFLFSTLGISASDFFTPNLATIAQLLGLDENVAGVTFLAFGNGSPDVFSTFSAMRADSGSLAIGELLGAATFIVSCVVGSICLIHPFRVNPVPFLRDVGFFSVAVGLLLVILWDGTIHAWEAALMVVLYLIYVGVVVVGSIIERRRERKRISEAMARAEYGDDEVPVPFEPYRDEPESPTRDTLPLPGPSTPSARVRALSNPAPPRLGLHTQDLPRRPYSRSPSPTPGGYMRHSFHSGYTPAAGLGAGYGHMPSFSLVGALEFRQVVASLHQDAAGSTLSMFDSPITPYAGGHYHPLRRGGSWSRPRTPSGVSTLSQSYHSGQGNGIGNGNVHDRERDPWDAALQLGLPLDDRSPRLTVTPANPASASAPAALNSLEATTTTADHHDDVHSPTGSAYLDQHAHMTASINSIPTISISRDPASPTASETDVDSLRPGNSQRWDQLSKWGKTKYVLTEIYFTLFPSLHRFKSQSVLGQIAAVFAAPAVMALTLTLPVVVMPYQANSSNPEKDHHRTTMGIDGFGGSENGSGHNLIDFEEEGVERALIAEEEAEEDHEHGVVFNKWLIATQAVLGPLFAVGVLFSGNSHQPYLFLAAAVFGVSVAVLIITFAQPHKDNVAFKMARCSMGFLVAIVWIMAIADEVVNVLQTFGFIFGLSDAIIGLTIFAVGNSLADLVANMSIAVFAPIMGFSACFGGPMLNILLGVGISGSYITSHPTDPGQNHIVLHFGKTLFVSTIGLLSLLAATLVFVPMNGYWLTRPWGAFLIASYVGIMCVNIVVELRGESP